MPWQLTPPQHTIAEAPFDARLFVHGPAGCGKTTAAVERLLRMLDAGVPAESILVLVPQRALGQPYVRALDALADFSGGLVDVVTLGGLARRTIDLFWPLVAEAVGFAHPDRPPTFLTIETAQFFMAQVVEPLIREQGYFDAVTIDRNRLYGQILDNLNKAAVMGFPHTEIGERLTAAWTGDPTQVRIYQDAQECANRFRALCLEHNLLDFSLQMEVFLRHLWPSTEGRAYLTGRYRHLIADNLEEDTPAAHDVLAAWIPQADSALLLYDEEAGYRSFLGADPDSAWALRELCDRTVRLDESLVNGPPMRLLVAHVRAAFGQTVETPPADLNLALRFRDYHFFPEMLDGVAEHIATAVEEGVPPGEIVVLAPYLSDALRFSLMARLEDLGVPARSHRPSRALNEEPATQCLLTLAALAHPAWETPPTMPEVAYALMEAIDGLDLVRAELLSHALYRSHEGRLRPFGQAPAGVQERVTYRLGEQYERLRQWLEAAQGHDPAPLDVFLRRLFGEVLSQRGFRFFHDLDAARATATLVTSVVKFRRAAEAPLTSQGLDVGCEYTRMVRAGLLAATYVPAWVDETPDAVLLAPAFTFLMSNRAVDVQFWVNVNSSGWWERLYQPVTHPYVLSRAWEPGRKWTDQDEQRIREQTLERLLIGLLRRCRDHVFLGLSTYDEHGFEQSGPLLRIIRKVLSAV